VRQTLETLTILVVDDIPEVRAMLVRALERLGYGTQQAPEGEAALALCEQQMPDIVLTDIRLPGTDGLTLTQRIRQRWPECPVVVMTGHSDEDSAIAALKSGACDYLKKPIDLTDLKTALDGVAQVLCGQREEFLHVLPIERLEFCVAVNNVPDRVLPLTTYLVRDASPLLTGVVRFHLRIALQELVTNAIEHGNLGISSQEKADALNRGDYDKVVQTRCQDAPYRDRRVMITVTYDRAGESVQYRIADQGQGFDWRHELRRARGIRLQGGSGRGIQLAKALVADLTYNDTGNEVILTLPVTLN
jgi:CheY-like chemotaxis protein